MTNGCWTWAPRKAFLFTVKISMLICNSALLNTGAMSEKTLRKKKSHIFDPGFQDVLIWVRAMRLELKRRSMRRRRNGRWWVDISHSCIEDLLTLCLVTFRSRDPEPDFYEPESDWKSVRMSPVNFTPPEDESAFAFLNEGTYPFISLPPHLTPSLPHPNFTSYRAKRLNWVKLPLFRLRCKN